ncbi:unnamed protein product [Caenorhabditis angaria]|uniref:Fatty-acid and retinol-binding protein 1 n=1 Tax=Caenorhabditis angaria TaxID=860376 RepID=A0A9P1MZM1_9PELO|nr:unnamed protein product [Caenorhabditis angaria]
MFRATIFACLALAAFCAPVPDVPNSVDDIPTEYKSLIPKEVVDHLQSITPEERKALKEVAQRYKEFKSEQDFLDALKVKSPSLHEKAQKLHNLVEEKIKNLNDEAKAFVKKLIADVRKIHGAYLKGEKPSLDSLKKSVKTYIDEYKSLSDGAKASIAKEFPILTGLAKNEKVKAIIGKYIN